MSIDLQYLLFLQNLREASGGILDGFFGILTNLAENTVFTAVAALFFWCLDKKTGVLILLAVSFNRLFAQILKISCCVYRPWLRSTLLHPVPSAFRTATGFSFPSGHSVTAAGLWGALAFRAKSRLLKVLLVLLVLLICFSRNWIGVHTPQDVLIGLVLGFAILTGLHFLLERMERRPGSDVYLLAGGLACCALLVLVAMYRQIPVLTDAQGHPLIDPAKIVLDGFNDSGFPAGVLLGWFIERRWIHFDPAAGSRTEKVLRYVCGTAILFLLTHFLRQYLGKGAAGCFFVPMVSGLFITALYPAVCRHFPRPAPRAKPEKQ